jgi:3-isopropylmalate/(R)-2-methylmalate dehydratase large subunit
VYKGKLGKWVGGKDLILHTIGRIGVDGALYCAMEFSGPVIEKLPMPDRLTMANMAIEAGGKSGIIAPDKITEAYVKGRAQRMYKFYSSDPDANYAQVIEIDCSKILPQVAVPFLPSNAKNARDLNKLTIDQVVVGSCTNGRIEDLRIAAGIIKGKKVHSSVRMLVIPATPWIWRQAMKEGLFDIFMNAGAIISPPTCGPCLGGHMGILADGERCVATTNRNFTGRMGALKSEVYLANPAVAAASAIKGRIVDPEQI